MIKKLGIALASVAQLVGASSVNQRVMVQFPVRAHAYLEDSVSGRGVCEKQLINVSLSLSSPLSKTNKHVLG